MVYEGRQRSGVKIPLQFAVACIELGELYRCVADLVRRQPRNGGRHLLVRRYNQINPPPIPIRVRSPLAREAAVGSGRDLGT